MHILVRKYLRTREQKLIAFFLILFLLIVLRLFWLQVVKGEYYKELLVEQHTTSTTLSAQRGHIFVKDKAGTQMQLTENVDLFTLFIDPKFLQIQLSNQTSQQNELLSKQIKSEIIEILTPIITDHLCVQYGVQPIDKRGCITNVQDFTKKELLPDPNTYYSFSGDTLLYTDNEEYNLSLQEIETSFDRETAESLVKQRLDSVIRNGIREYNYIGRFDNNQLLEKLRQSSLSQSIKIVDDAYIYINPTLASQSSQAVEILYKIFQSSGESVSRQKFEALLVPQEIRYIRITTGMNSKIAKRILEEKQAGYTYGVQTYGIPLFHGVGLEEYQERYYPHGTFMSNVLGYVTGEGESHYGVEEYFDTMLKGKDGKILGLSTPWIGDIGANSFEIAEPIDGNTITLTIDPVIQKEIENAANYYTKAFNADSIAITVLDPHTGKVKGLANSPGFDPNNPNASYKLRPLRYDERRIIDDTTFIEIPVFTFSGEQLIQTNSETRATSGQKKYIFENLLGPQVFVDKNISFPYEPGSIFKTITLAIGIDSNSVGLQEFYQDDGKVEIGPYTIANVSDKCLGYNTFSHALGFSCNVGMVRIAQRMTKYVFYEYLKALGFGSLTSIELAGEEGGTLPDFNTVSVARYFNNTYGQGILATPLQMAVAYASTVNGGVYIKPTLIESIFDTENNTAIHIPAPERKYVFNPETSEQIKKALVSVVEQGGLQAYRKEGYSLGGKAGTSEIAFKGKYQGGAGRTNGSFVGIVTAENTNYVIAIQVRRPRTSPWGSDTAGRIFSQLSEFLLSYDAIEE